MVANFASKAAEAEPHLGGVSFERSNQLRQRAHELIPGGAHTYAKAVSYTHLTLPTILLV